MNEMIEALRLQGCTVDACGSRVTCDPPPTTSDFDFLVEAPGVDVTDMLDAAEFSREEGESYVGQFNVFTSWRRGDVNFIVTSDAEFARRHRAAGHVCKNLNLMEKSDRVMVFQAVLYGNILEGGTA